MAIETEITGRFTTKSGTTMISFAAKRGDGRNWAAPEHVVRRGLSGDALVGLAVRIEVDGDRITQVQRNKNQAGGASTAEKVAGLQPQANTASGQTAARHVLPYGFVPIDLDRPVADSPVWHDGSSGGEFLSGEILCELEALTPLLPGNARYPVRKDGKDDGALMVKDAIRDILAKLGGEKPKAGKQIAEPLRLPDDRVVIAGSAIKGMMRHSLGALTAAPMERVMEHHFSYRPNLGHVDSAPQLECRPAIVKAISKDLIEVDVLPRTKSAVFLHGSAPASFSAHSPGAPVKGMHSDLAFGVWKWDNVAKKQVFNAGDKNRLSHAPGLSVNLDHVLYRYRGGIDGEGTLANAFKKGSNTHKEALISTADLDPKKVTRKAISADVLEKYRLTQKVLSDIQGGHLSHAHPLTKNLCPGGVEKASKGIRDAEKLELDQLIYVEIEVTGSGMGEIRSFGHNYQYRWAYTSSVRTKNGKTRACLTPTKDERTPGGRSQGEDIDPEKLTGARLLFGYVRDNETNRIGKGVFERLAGRIAINHAVSVGVPDFLGDPETGYCVPLRILGQPKPSAWEFYLQQPRDNAEPLVTYGDLPGDAGGELAGRKFYRHQKPTTEKDIRATTPPDISSDQATLARFICKPGTKFRFAIRFARLRDWELGALLAVLEPHLLADGGNPKVYAHKLGLGRPLGMGSIRIMRKDIRIRLEKEVGFLDGAEKAKLVEQALKAIADEVKQNVDGWLEVHKVVDGRHLAYPLADTSVYGKTVQTIYAWHTNLRREYSKLRRQKSADWYQLR